MALQNNNDRKPKSMASAAKEEALEAGSQEPVKAPSMEFNIPTGIPSDSPTARQRMEDLERSRGGFSFLAQSAIRGAAAGAKAAQGAASPTGAFLQGVNAGIDIPQQLYAEKRAQLQSTIDASPLFVTMPELANTPGYEAFKNMPTAIAVKAMQTIAADAIKLKMQEESTKSVQQAQISAQEAAGSISDITEATSYANMFNRAYGLTGPSAVKPQELMGSRKEDVDNFIKRQAGGVGSTKAAFEIDPNQPVEKANETLSSMYKGVPVERTNPYFKMNPMLAAKIKEINIKSADKDIEQATAKSEVANVLEADLLKAKELAANVNTGPVVGRIPGRTVYGADAAALEQIANRMLPTMRQGMPGAVSDRDMAIFQRANIGINQKPEVNMRIIDQGLAIANRQKAKAAYISNWANVYGDTVGAEAAWAKHANTNRLFQNDGSVNAASVNSDTNIISPTSVPEANVAVEPKSNTPGAKQYRTADGREFWGVKSADGKSILEVE